MLYFNSTNGLLKLIVIPGAILILFLNRMVIVVFPQNYPPLPLTHGARFGYFRSRIIYYSTPNVVGLNKESVALKTYFRRQVLEYPNNKISDSPRPFSRT